MRSTAGGPWQSLLCLDSEVEDAAGVEHEIGLATGVVMVMHEQP